MKFVYSIQCHNFQKRLCWVLSSIIQQTCFPFDITIDIACLKNNGNPSTEDVAKKFNSIGLKVSLTHIDDTETFARRGLVRNIQLKNAIDMNADYIYFSDSDHVYHPEMFQKLIEWLNTNRHKYHSCIFSRIKQHTTIDSANSLVDAINYNDPYINNAFKIVSGLPIEDHLDKSQLAPGNMQIVSIQDAINLSNGMYCNPNKVRDFHLFKRGQWAKSDHVFRGNIGHSKAIKLPLQIHLNHRRDRDALKHIEDQR